MERMLFKCATAMLFAAILCVSTAAAKPRVEMDVVFEPGLSANSAAQKWTKLLGDLGLRDVHFRPLQSDDHVAVKAQGSGDAAVYQVTVLLNSRGTLDTPGGQFSQSDGPKLKKWLDELQAGAGRPGGQKTIFGFSPKQFDELKRALSVPLNSSTKGVRPEKVIDQIRTALAVPLSIDPPIARAVAADEPVRDELQGVSIGTALAALARPAGGVLLPRVGNRGIELVITAPPSNGEIWPIGWPSEETDESKVVPKLFEFANVDLGNASAAKAIDAIAERIQIPLLFDYNSMVKNRVDLTKPIKITPGKTYFRRVLDRVLFQAGLKAELRLDDAGKPLLWITTS